jgi:hypothetical protein
MNVRLALGVGGALVAIAAAACVGDDPVIGATDPGTDSGTGSEAGLTEGGGPLEGGGTPDGGNEAGPLPPPAKGDYVWDVHFSPGSTPTSLAEAVPIGTNGTLIGGASFIEALPTIEGKPTTGPAIGTGFFEMDAAKTVAWAKSFAAYTASSVAVDSAGDVYVVGAFNAVSADFPIEGGTTTTLTNANSVADFVVKINHLTGGIKWARSIATATGDTSADSIAVIGTDVVVGYSIFNAKATFTLRNGGGGANFVTVPAAGTSAGYDGLVLFLDGANGDALWSKYLSGPGQDRVRSVALDAARNVYVGGYMGSSLDVDGVPTLSGTASITPYFLRFDAGGTHAVGASKVVTAAGAGGNGELLALSPAPNGDIVTCGRFTGSLTFDSGMVKASNGQDGFVARYSKAGVATWVQSFGGSGIDECSALVVDPTDRIVLAANHRSSGVTIAGHALADPSGASKPTAAVVKLGGAGDFLWAYDVIGTSASITSVAVMATGDVLYAGNFIGTQDLGGGTGIMSPNGGLNPMAFVVRRKY